MLNNLKLPDTNIVRGVIKAELFENKGEKVKIHKRQKIKMDLTMERRAGEEKIEIV